MRERNRLVQIFITHSLPLLIVVVLLGSGATLLTRNFVRQSNIRQTSQTLNQAVVYFDSILDEIDALNLMFSTNPEITSKLQQVLNDNLMGYENYREIRLIRSFISAPANTRPYIEGIYVYIQNDNDLVMGNEGFITLSNTNTPEWFTDYFTIEHSSRAESEPLTVKRSPETKVIRISRPVTNVMGNQIGVIVLDLKESSLSNTYASFFPEESERLTVMNQNGAVLFSTPSDRQPFLESEMEYFTARSMKYGWTYSLGIYRPMLYALSTTIMRYTFALSVVAILLGLAITFQANKKERAFLGTVINQLQKAGAATDIKEPRKNRNLFVYLNDYVLKSFLEQDYLRIQKEAIEYRALQMQINPHFLFNTLDTINWKAIKLTSGQNDVSTMIQDLSKLLKYSLHVDNLEGVGLDEEIEEVQNYIDLQRFRFRDRFVFSRHIEETCLSARVPSMILQPVLENCFNHGFVENEVLEIELSVRITGERISIGITDNGAPIGEETLAELNDVSIDALQSSRALGIRNIRKRLQLFTRGQSSVTVRSDGIRGVSVIITIPRV